MKWSTACVDWEQRIKQQRSLIPIAPLFPDYADECMDVFNELRVVDAPGSPKVKDTSAPWIMEFARTLFGSYNPDTGERLITEYFLSVPKKQGKSLYAAAIMVTLLVKNWRKSAELIILAPTVEVSGNSFIAARDMIRADEDLDSLLQIQEHVKTITHRMTGATLKIVASDSSTVAGKKASYILIDELHEFGSMNRAEGMLREATGGLAARPEGAIIYITTQSDEPPAGVFRQKLQYARGVRDGRIDDPQFLPVIYEFPQDMLDEGLHRTSEGFKYVHPNLGYSISQKFLDRELEKAVDGGEDSLIGFLSKFANVEVGVALQSNRWAGADYWQAQASPSMTLEEILERSDVVTVGIDGGGLDDLLGLAVVGRDKTTRQWLLWNYAWAHPSVLERHKQEAARLKDFAKAGEMTLVTRVGDDVEDIGALVARVQATGLLHKVGLDPAGIGAILDALVEAGVDEEKIAGISQGWRLGGAIKTAERKLAEGAMVHAGQALMSWCVGNAKVEPRANSIMITKQGSGAAKIDPLMASFNAIELMSTNPAPARKEYRIHFV